MSSQSRQRAPQVASEQATPAAQAAPATSNAAAQEALASKQARTFAPLVPGTVVEARVDVGKVSAHVASLWGQVSAAGAARASMTRAETAVGSYEGSGLAEQVRELAGTGALARMGRWESEWVNVGSGSGVSGEDGLFSTPFAQAKVEILPLVGDLEPIATGTGNASASASGERGRIDHQFDELGAGGGGVGAKVATESERITGAGGGTGLSMDVPMTTYRGVLGFDCVVRFKRTFGPAEDRSGRVVAGEVCLTSALGY